MLTSLEPGEVLFLDEPTIGLDVVSQKNVRQFLRDYNRRHRVTILLTSHYMADIQELCERVIVIHRGRKIYDGALDRLEAVLQAPVSIVDAPGARPLARARGIGRAICERMAEHGAKVVVSSRKLDACQEVVDAITMDCAGDCECDWVLATKNRANKPVWTRPRGLKHLKFIRVLP